MNIGDNVRSKRSPEKGFITKIISDKEVEIEIYGGFRLPFLKSELVVVAEAEKIYFGDSTQSTTKIESVPNSSHQLIADKGLFLGLKYVNDKDLEILIINNTDLLLFFCLGTEYQLRYQGIAGGEIKAKTFSKVHQASITNIAEWATLIVQFMIFQHGVSPFRQPQVRRLNIKSLLLQKSKDSIPLVNTKGYCIQLDDEIRKIEASVIREHLLENKSETTPPVTVGSQRNKALEIDLHVEALQKKCIVEKGKELEAQLLFFEKALDEAIAQGADSLTAIHGVGNGILKNEIAKIVGKNSHIAYFKDAQREKFGYGATFIKIK